MYLKRGDKNNAGGDFEHAVYYSHNTNASALHSAGMLWYEDGNFETAADKLSQACHIDSRYCRDRDRAAAAFHKQLRKEYEKTKGFDVFTAIGDGLGNVATALSNGASGGSSGDSDASDASPSGGSDGSGGGRNSYAGGNGGSNAQSYAEKDKQRIAQSVNRAVEQKLWNMNNPYR